MVRIYIMFFSFLSIVFLIKADLSGPITSQIIDPGSVQYSAAYWYSESKSYVNGGVTFTFPTNLFLQTPTVVASISIGSYSIFTTYSCVITSISSNSVTVRVNTGTLLTIGEAPTNSCTVNVWAIGTAN
ncbi:hypothetical protein EKK58_02240 [Candidatus Dependentiae bacterium]|nr:MAG: hypothetical protein EKK58_02240 [Candidatus Dependentiae bacterium]